MRSSKKEQKVAEIPMKCAVCNECYRLANSLRPNCHFGGPYTGYMVVDYKLKD